MDELDFNHVDQTLSNEEITTKGNKGHHMKRYQSEIPKDLARRALLERANEHNVKGPRRMNKNQLERRLSIEDADLPFKDSDVPKNKAVRYKLTRLLKQYVLNRENEEVD